MADVCTRRFDPIVLVAGHSEAEVLDLTVTMCKGLAAEALAVTLFKRRLSDASAEELSHDKKTARRVTMSILNIFGGDWAETLAEAEAYRPYSATLKWDVWIPETVESLREKQVFCATWVIKENLTSRPVRKLVSHLELRIHELENRQLARALRIAST